MSPRFNRLWAGVLAANLADGFVAVTVMLLAARLTDDPLLVALVSAASLLPAAVFSVGSGVIVDRLDRRSVLVGSSLARAALLVGLAVAVGTGAASAAALAIVVLVLGAGESLHDTSAVAVVPMIAGRDNLVAANSRIQAGQLVVQQFVAVPIAAVIFAVAAAAPLWVSAVAYAAAGIVLHTIGPQRVTRHGAPGETAETDEAGSPGGETVTTETDGVAASATVADLDGDPVPAAAAPGKGWIEGWRAINADPSLRALVGVGVTVVAAMAFGQAAIALFALRTLGIPEEGFGAFTVAAGVGALGGLAVAGRLARRWQAGPVLVVTVAWLGAVMALLGAAPNLVVGVLAFGLVGTAAGVWNIIAVSVRQSLIPDHVLGRVTGLMQSMSSGSAVVATILGGLAARWDLRAPMLIAAAAILVTAATTGRTLLPLRLTRASAADAERVADTSDAETLADTGAVHGADGSSHRVTAP